jgi:hypothetical protein
MRRMKTATDCKKMEDICIIGKSWCAPIYMLRWLEAPLVFGKLQLLPFPIIIQLGSRIE